MSSIPPSLHVRSRSKMTWILGAGSIGFLGAAIAVVFSMGGEAKKDAAPSLPPSVATSAPSPEAGSAPEPAELSGDANPLGPEDSSVRVAGSTKLPPLTRPGLPRPPRQNTAGTSTAKKLPANPY